MKSSADDRKKRGFVNEDEVLVSDYYDSDLLVAKLKSTKPTERTSAAIIIRKKLLVELIPELIIALKLESKLYTKIEISNALAAFKENSIGPLIPLLGEIGNNQHKILPVKPFNKNSYPLPRDIVARILVNIKKSVIPVIITAKLTSKQFPEAVDVLGHISFYSNNTEALPFLMKCYKEKNKDMVLQWKVLRAFSAFNNDEIKSLLRSAIKNSKTKEFVWEAERSLRIITARGSKMKIVHTDGRNPDFICLCKQLDSNLEEIAGKVIQREKYVQYNQLNDINNAVVIYIDGSPVAGGSFKFYEKSIAEIKRIFVKKEYRGRSLSKILMKELETKALKAGYGKLILETGELLKASMSLYKAIGFKIIDNYGPYKNMEESVCMEKLLP